MNDTYELSDRATVLIVDPSLNSIRILNAILSEDYRILFATSGTKGLNLARSEHPDVVLLEISLPDVDGFELCQTLKSDAATKAIPLILISEHREDEDREMGLRLGCADYISKPVSPAEVKLRVYNQLRIRRNEELILRRALYDSLTGLPNRNLVLDRLRYSIAHDLRAGLKTGVMFVDIDNFKYINDSIGHEAGDQILNDVGQRLMHAVREVDTVGRLSGDEFLVVLPGLRETANASQIASKLRRVMEAPFVYREMAIYVTISIGISLSPEDTDDFKQLIANSDVAMYQAKQYGKDNYRLYTPEMNNNINRRMRIEFYLHNILERKELEVYYQPIVDIQKDEVIGAEALLRWHNEELGWIGPDEFIPLAEQSNQIRDIGLFVLSTACADFTKLTNIAGLPLQLAVNISPQQIRQLQFLDSLVKTITQTGFDAKRLELEVTEGLLLGNQPHVKEMMVHLRSLGTLLSMDDFGTGYSSLSYLLQFPFDSLKIDRSFVDGITEIKMNEALATAVISMAKGLELTTIAEGIENVEQLAMLKEKGCELAQGYYFSKPVPLEEFVQYLAQHPHPVSDALKGTVAKSGTG